MSYRIAINKGGNGHEQENCGPCPRLEGAKCGVAEILHAYRIDDKTEISPRRLAAEHCSCAGKECGFYDFVRSGVGAGTMYEEVCKRLENPEDQECIREELLALMNMLKIPGPGIVLISNAKKKQITMAMMLRRV